MKRDYVAVMFEEIRDQNKALFEAFGLMQDKMETLATKDSVDALTVRVSTLKVAVTETNKDLRNLDNRVALLATRVGKLDNRVAGIEDRVTALA